MVGTNGAAHRRSSLAASTSTFSTTRHSRRPFALTAFRLMRPCGKSLPSWARKLGIGGFLIVLRAFAVSYQRYSVGFFRGRSIVQVARNPGRSEPWLQ